MRQIWVAQEFVDTDDDVGYYEFFEASQTLSVLQAACEKAEGISLSWENKASTFDPQEYWVGSAGNIEYHIMQHSLLD